MISPATGDSTIELSNEVGIDYCSSDDEIDFDLGSSDEDGERLINPFAVPVLPGRE